MAFLNRFLRAESVSGQKSNLCWEFCSLKCCMFFGGEKERATAK